MFLALALLACTTETPEAPVAPAPQAKAEPVPAPAASPLTLKSGSINLVQLKNGSAEVPATFATPTGTLSPQGSGEFEIDLGSWDSALELRDTRVRETFFHATEHPKATFKATALTPEKPEMPLNSSIAVGASHKGVLKGELSLYSGSTSVEIPVSMAQSAPGEFTLSTPAPFQVSIEALGLNENLQALITECAHESVGDAVDVSFELVFAE